MICPISLSVIRMYNWSVDKKEIKKDREKYTVWKIEQMVNFGLDGEKVKASDLKKYWNKIKIDGFRRRFLGLLLYGKKDFDQETIVDS